MKKWFKNNWEIILVIFIALLLFYNPLFSNQPLGLDAIGHLSKVSYIQQFPFSNWDLSWYSGSLFLKMYPPLFYYVVSVFPNVFFGSNLICFLSLLFTGLGIYFLVNYLTKNKKIALFSGLSFFTVLSISYYWISTGNLPYFAALWTIPFSLYFLEKFIQKKTKRDLFFFSLILFVSIITHVVTGFLIGLLMVLRFLFEGLNFKNFKEIFFCGGIPVLLSAFWFLPFLFFSSSAGEYSGYVPTFLQLFGLTDFVAWGFYAGGIGIISFLFMVVFLFFIFKRKKFNKEIKYYFSISFILGFLLLGGLGKYYPFGVDPVRFILPFSILLIIFSGILIQKLKLSRKRFFVLLWIILLIGGLVWNFSIINQNFERFSYYKEDSRYGIFKNILAEGFPLENEIENYRFGTSKFVFGETLTYFMPSISQTFGYQDAGMLNAPRYYDMRWHIWTSENINDSIFWLDWFGIKYFEVEDSEVSDKFINDLRFIQIMNYSNGYNFVLYEYLEAKPIISLVNSLGNGTAREVKNFLFERNNPDEIKITYGNFQNGDVVLFKEFYHENWIAKELNSNKKLEVLKVGPGFMAAYPNENSIGIKFYYQKSFIEYSGIIFSFIGVLGLIFYRKIRNFLKLT